MPPPSDPRVACLCCANTAGPWLFEAGCELVCIACAAWIADTFRYAVAVRLRHQLGFSGPPPWRARWAPCAPGEEVPWG